MFSALKAPSLTWTDLSMWGACPFPALSGIALLSLPILGSSQTASSPLVICYEPQLHWAFICHHLLSFLNHLELKQHCFGDLLEQYKGTTVGRGRQRQGTEGH